MQPFECFSEPFFFAMLFWRFLAISTKSLLNDVQNKTSSLLKNWKIRARITPNTHIFHTLRVIRAKRSCPAWQRVKSFDEMNNMKQYMIQGRFNYRIKICSQILNYLSFTLDHKRVEAKMKLQRLPIHYVKSVQIQSFFWYVFSLIWTEYGDLLYL